MIRNNFIYLCSLFVLLGGFHTFATENEDSSITKSSIKNVIEKESNKKDNLILSLDNIFILSDNNNFSFLKSILYTSPPLSSYTNTKTTRSLQSRQAITPTSDLTLVLQLKTSESSDAISLLSNINARAYTLSVGAYSIGDYYTESPKGEYWVSMRKPFSIYVESMRSPISGNYPTSNYFGFDASNGHTFSFGAKPSDKGYPTDSNVAPQHFSTDKSRGKANTVSRNNSDYLETTVFFTPLKDNMDYIFSYSTWMTGHSMPPYRYPGVKIKVDGSAPTVHGLQTNVGWVNYPVTINVTGTDSRSGMKAMNLYEENGTFLAGQKASVYYVNSQEGIRNFKLSVSDNIANGQTYYIQHKIDVTAPKISLSQSPSGWTNNPNITINASISDSGGSGLAIKKYASGSQDAYYFKSSGTALSGNSFTVNSNGTYTVYARDNAGNETISKITISNIDTAPPTGSAWIENLSLTGFDVVIGNITDNGLSGVDRIEICAWRDGWDIDGKWQTNYANGGTARFRVNISDYGYKTGQYYVDVRLYDRAGNGGTPIAHLTAVVQNPKVYSQPIVISNHEYEQNGVYWVKSGEPFTAKVYGYTDPINNNYKINNQFLLARAENSINFNNFKAFQAVIPNWIGNWANHSEFKLSTDSYSTSLNLSGGSYSVRTDGSWVDSFFNLTLTGNEDVKLSPVSRIYTDGIDIDSDWNSSSITVKSDSGAPIINFTQSPNVGSNWTNKDVTVRINASDSRSGINSWSVRKKVDNGAWTNLGTNINSVLLNSTGVHTVEVTAKDNVGNTTTKSIIIKIDKIVPTISNIPANNSEYIDFTSLDINATDSGGSLMKKLSLYKNNALLTDGVSSISYFENVNGTHTYKVVAEDNAGNIIEQIFTITILPDDINLIATPKPVNNLIRLDWNHKILNNKSYSVYQKREDQSSFSVVPNTGDSFTDIFLDNTFASDVTAPTIPSGVYINETDTHIRFNIIPSKDIGTTYDFYVVSKDNYGKLTQSNTDSETITTEIKGYTYIVDGNPSTIPDNVVDSNTSTLQIDTPILGGFPHYLHIAAIDNAGNMSNTNHILLWEGVEDNWFNQEVARQAGKSLLDVRLSDYKNMQVLTLRKKGISGKVPDDIKKAVNLEEIDLYTNNITDISNIANLPKLEYLQLGNNNISDISTLTNLDSLTFLNIFNNNVSDISVVSSMNNLQQLYLHKNNITDISAIENLSNLTELYVELNYLNVDDTKTSQILNKFESNGCYVVSLPQNIVKGNNVEELHLNMGDTFIPSPLLGLSFNRRDILPGYSMLNPTEFKVHITNPGIVKVENNKITALVEGETDVLIIYKKHNNILSVPFKIVVSPNNDVVNDNSIDNETSSDELSNDNSTDSKEIDSDKNISSDDTEPSKIDNLSNDNTDSN